MELSELRQACNETISRGGGAVMLVVPGPGHGVSRRLCGTQGPRGEIINVNAAGDSVCRFDPAAVLRFLDRSEKGRQ